jgi:hypothetical protein
MVADARTAGFTEKKTVENRDGHVGSGMEAGMTEGYARLDELLAGLLQTR